MEAKRSILITGLVTAIAPVAWGANYPVTQHLLPTDRPLLGSALRALPAALALLAITRTRPVGSWWWRAAVLGTLTVGVFFVLIYVAAQRLPSGVAPTLMAMSPAVMMLFAWPMLGERPRRRPLLGAAVGVIGVGLMLLRGGDLDALGLLASAAAMTMSCAGFVLGQRWRPPVPPLTFAAWQLTAGSVLLVPVALLVEGAPPTPDRGMVVGLAFGAFVATALAYGCWFHGLSRLSAGTVGLIGLLNPVTGATIAVAMGDPFGTAQAIGAALVVGGVAYGVTAPSRPGPVPDVRPTNETSPGPRADALAPAPSH